VKAPLPGTLFSRLVLVLVVGLIAAQLLAGIVLYQERIRTLYHASGLQSARRISEIVHLLENHTSDEREHLIRVLNTLRLRIGLDGAAWNEAGTDSGNEALESLFSTILRRNLGDGRPMQVMVTRAEGLPEVFPKLQHQRIGRGQGPGMGRRHRMAEMGLSPGSGLYFLARVQLQDGAWVTFDHRVPEQSADWPWRLSLTVAILLIAVVALSTLAVRWLTRPLSTLAGAAEQLGKDINSPPVPESGPLEVKRAAMAFNTMQTRLRLFIEDRTRILAAVSHDLKTPLTRMRLRTETLKDSHLQIRFLKDLDEMQSMTNATLDFLQGMETQEKIQPVDTCALLESLIEDAEERGQSIQLKGDQPRPFPARPLALKRCLYNLIENALKYGRNAQVHLRELPERLEIVIADEGPGIPEDKLDQVFEPFFRLESSRGRDTGGTGLGLSIARNIARAHGGDLVLRNHPEKGLEAILSLPR
jgi:signal transduction histidine kinase